MKDLIIKRLKALHPNCLIRDVQLEEIDNGFKVRYLKVKRDDTSMRCNLTVVVEGRE